MRWHEYNPLTEAPEFRRLSHSRQEVLRFLWRRADTDGVVRRLICVRKMAERLDMPKITVRKALQYLDQQGVIHRHPGSGRDRSRYVVPIAWNQPLTDVDSPPPQSAPAARTRPATTATATDDALFSVASVASPSSRPEWLPRRPRLEPAPTADTPEPSITTNGNRSAAASVPAQRATTDDDEDRSLWCPRAIEEGRRHKNSRCCHSTARQIAAQEKTAAAQRAREREREATAARAAAAAEAVPSTAIPEYEEARRRYVGRRPQTS